MLIEQIQKIVNNLLENKKLTDFTTGTVTRVNPLEIKLEGTMLPIPRAALILTQTVSDYQVDMTIGNETQSVTIRNGLKSGDNVILLRVLNGQNFIVLSKAVP
jgi:hypothetical protein